MELRRQIKGPQALPAHGGRYKHRDGGPRSGRLTGQLAPGYALRELARQPTETRTNNPKEIQSTEKLGLD